jgi:hypothetical protein
MIFANEIAEIVHTSCDSFHGAANKNLGDCFLMVWKYNDLVTIDSQGEI